MRNVSSDPRILGCNPGCNIGCNRDRAASSYRADHTGQSARCTTVTTAVPPSQPRTR